MKKLTLTAAIAILLTCNCMAQNLTVKGDMNGDGVVSVADVTLLTDDILNNTSELISASTSGQGMCYGVSYVDLGLPSGLLWASCNVGATSPEDYGLYFAWGETKGYAKSTTHYFDWDHYKYGTSATTITKYCTNSTYGTVDNLTTLEASDDAATANLGAPWRMPTNTEWSELVSNTNWTWTTLNSIPGYLVTSKKNGNSIFLPTPGYRSSYSRVNEGKTGIYWSSVVSSTSRWASTLSFGATYQHFSAWDRYMGLPVRAVLSASDEETYSGSITSFSKTLEVGDIFNLGAESDSGTDITYTTTNSAIASVDAFGKVTAVGEGTARITALANGTRDAACYIIRVVDVDYVTITNADGTTTRWAKMNVGATSIADDPETAYGDYISWGEVEPYYVSKSYTEDGDLGDIVWKTGKTAYDYTNYYGSETYVEWTPKPYRGDQVLKRSCDAATHALGDNWRMPTQEDFQNLWVACGYGASDWLRSLEYWHVVSNHTQGAYKIMAGRNTTIGSTTYNVAGVIFVPNASKLDEVIFFPLAGFISDDVNYPSSPGTYGHYWTSTLYTETGYTTLGYEMYYNSLGLSNSANGRRPLGLSVRPVSDY